MLFRSCGKYGHFANDCKVKQKINQLQINDKEKEELYNLLTNSECLIQWEAIYIGIQMQEKASSDKSSIASLQTSSFSF